MKKQLLTSTALVAASVLAAGGAAHAQKKAKKPYMTVNGYHEQIVGFTIDQDEAVVGDKSTLDVHGESEVHFNGHAKLDNGITLRAHWELEGAGDGAPGSDIIDETYIIIRGSFGQLTLGAEDNAGHLMTIGYSGSWATGVGQSVTFDQSDWITTPPGFNKDFDGTVNDVRLRSGDNDSDKITYYSPRFGGFQLGVSYIPEFAQDTAGSVASVSAAYHDGIALGANFSRKFDQFGIGVAAGYLTADSPDGVAVPDPDAWNLAARIDFGGFRVSGAVKKNNDMRDSVGTGTATSNSGTIFDVGARYRWGPNGVSLVYVHGENEAVIATPGDDELDSGMLSYARNLGPGVKWSVNLIWADFKGEDVGSSDDNDGTALTTAVRMNF
jgi:predicted porin